jgi:hypothetical protein
MKHFILLTITFVTVNVFFSLFFCLNAHAYLDPGTGSYILQIIIAAIIGSFFVIKPFFTKIKGFLKRLFSKGREDERSQE